MQLEYSQSPILPSAPVGSKMSGLWGLPIANVTLSSSMGRLWGPLNYECSCEQFIECSFGSTQSVYVSMSSSVNGLYGLIIF